MSNQIEEYQESVRDTRRVVYTSRGMGQKLFNIQVDTRGRWWIQKCMPRRTEVPREAVLEWLRIMGQEKVADDLAALPEGSVATYTRPLSLLPLDRCTKEWEWVEEGAAGKVAVELWSDVRGGWCRRLTMDGVETSRVPVSVKEACKTARAVGEFDQPEEWESRAPRWPELFEE